MNGATNGDTNGATNGAMNGATNGATNAAMNGATKPDHAGDCRVSAGQPTQPYLNLDSEEIERLYMPSNWTQSGLTPDEILTKHVNVLLKGTAMAHESSPFSIGVSYGNSDKQKMDILMPDSLPRDCPIFLYIHGGYWQMLGREYSSFMALPIYRAGGAVVAIGYDLAPNVSLEDIIEEVKVAVKYVLHLAKRRESRGVYICGHSAGGHLSATMLAVDWLKESHISPSLIKGAALVSGVFDVRPLVRTSENWNLKLDEERAWQCSPFRHVADVAHYAKNAKVLVAVGGAESPEFLRQSREYHEMLVAEGISSQYIEIPGEDHFSIVEQLTESQNSLTQKVLSWMGLKL